MNTYKEKQLLSIVVPLFNEEANIDPFLIELGNIARKLDAYELELIFVNDGSSDNSRTRIIKNQEHDPRIRYIEFSRNFGKEAATTAGLHHAKGDAALLIDADLQHPIELIPEFVKKWEEGGEVVVGVRNASKSEGVIRKVGSAMFYAIMKLIGETDIVPRATDFRLIDRMVIDEFNRLVEHGRMTRGLIDWLGFKRVYLYFDANEREHGTPSYRISSLIKLAVASFIAHSFFPLRFVGYLGVVITLISGALGVVELLDRFVFNWGLNFSGPAELATVNMFIGGVILAALGLKAFYIEQIFRNAQGRPLYVIRTKL